MSKKQIVNAFGESVVRAAPKIRNVKPTGTQVLIEILTGQEVLGTSLTVTDNVVTGAPQGYIKGLGPKVSEDWGFRVGDRVIVHGNYTPLPEGKILDKANDHRFWILVEPHQVKAVLIEE